MWKVVPRLLARPWLQLLQLNLVGWLVVRPCLPTLLGAEKDLQVQLVLSSPVVILPQTVACLDRWHGLRGLFILTFLL